MPAKNTRNRSDRYPHHVYNRAREGRRMFIDNADRDKFIDLIASRLCCSTRLAGREYRYSQVIEGLDLYAICLMTTHYHLIVWQKHKEILRRFMQSLISVYVRYFNRRHGTTGDMFEGPYRARPITTKKKLKYAIAYVHANHDDGPAYKCSSYGAYLDPDKRPGWLNAKTPLSYFGGPTKYAAFMNDHATRAALNNYFFDDDE